MFNVFFDSVEPALSFVTNLDSQPTKAANSLGLHAPRAFIF
jgi:hypothetical protein